MKLRIPYEEIDSFRNDSYQPRYEYFAIVTANRKLRIPGNFPEISRLSNEIRVRRSGIEGPNYPQFVDITRGPKSNPSPAHKYAVKPVAIGLSTIFAVALAWELGQPVYPSVIALVGITLFAQASSDALQCFRREREERLEEIVEW